MIVVSTGFVVRWDPTGYNLVAWHRHDGPQVSGCPDDVFEHLSGSELIDVTIAQLYNFLPGGQSPSCKGWRQLELWDHDRELGRT